MKKIVIATDGSPSAIQAIEFGIELAVEQGVEPTFVHVAPGTEVLPVTGFAMGPVLARDWAESLGGYEAYAITETGETWQTRGFAARLALD